MARVIRFDPTLHAGDPSWERFPRFDEVDSHVDAQAAKLFDAATSLQRERELYARVEARLAPDDRSLLRELYTAITSHLEKYERAAYIVGLQAATGRLEGLPPLVDDRKSDPEPA